MKQQSSSDGDPMAATAYDTDLAYVHDVGFGDYASGIAPGILATLHASGIDSGRVVDLGCGSGIWARELVEAGFAVTGVDLSPAMIALARRRVPAGDFYVESFRRFPFPDCRAVTALGEVLNYLFDARNSMKSLGRLFRRTFDALTPDGLFVFDVAEPGRARDRTRSFTEGDDWACLVEYLHDDRRQRLTRRIVTFRNSGKSYRRHEESHTQQLFKGRELATMLRDIGFRVRLVRRFGDYPLFPHQVGLIARKPGR